MAPGVLDPLSKALIYVAVSVTNGCAYCIASHTAAAQKAGMSAEMFAELMTVVGIIGIDRGVPHWWRVCYDQVRQLPRYGLIMLSDSLSHAVTLEAVTSAFLTCSLAWLS